MDLSIMALIFTYLSSLLLFFVSLYIYRTNNKKYFLGFSQGLFIFSLVHLIQILHLSIIYITYLKPYIYVLQILSTLFIVLGLLDYIKKEVCKYYIFITITSISITTISSYIASFYIDRELLIQFIFGIVMIFSFMFFFYYFRKSRFGKHLTGISTLAFGIIHIGYSFNGGYGKNIYLSYFLEPSILLLIGIGLLMSHYEITKSELEISEKKYRLAMEGSNDGLLEYDIINKITHLSPQTLNLIGLSVENTIIDFETWKSFIHKDDLDNFNNNIQIHILGMSDSYRSEYRIKNKDGYYRWILAKGKIMLDDKNRPIKIIGSHTDVTERKTREERIYNLAYFDNITKLPNRYYLEDKINEEINENENFHVLLIGPNGFEKINDTLGHAMGDDFLRIISIEIKRSLPQNSILTRFGGDQFVVMIKNHNKIEIEGICKEILYNIKKPIYLNNNIFHISVSIGISYYPDDGINCMEVLKNTDLAMYKAKERKESYRFYDNFMNVEIQNRIYLEKILHEAVEKNEFLVYYQLQKDIVKNKFTGAEALVRWIHPEKGFISPAEFIPLAEETGLIINIGEFVLREACIKAESLHDNGYSDFNISVNISDVQLQNRDFLKIVKNILKETGLDAKYLTLEITESIVMKSLEENINVLEKLRELGVRIALDDFGTGYSSFNYLMSLPIDILKIDKSFVDEITDNDKSKSIFASIVNIAKELNLSIVAEGVETEEQLEILKSLNCDKIQGYLFSKPSPEIEKNIT